MNQISDQDIMNSIRDIPDFPKKGVLFKDLTTAFKDPAILIAISERIYRYYKEAGVTKVVGIESRGFIAGSIVAEKLKAGFVPIRKPGKLPAETFKYEYELEYGTDTIEIHKDALDNNDVVLLHDDLLATGGTVGAAIELIKKFNVKKVLVNFIVELSFLEGRRSIPEEIDIYSIIKS
jgi:adenine phosphoribosyltransferase